MKLDDFDGEQDKQSNLQAIINRKSAQKATASKATASRVEKTTRRVGL
jgi:hypothetical protein